MRRVRLSSRKPLWQDMQRLRSDKDSDNVDIWSQQQFLHRWNHTDSYLKRYIKIPEKHPPGHTLPRKLWCRLNRARTGHGRFKHHMYRMGLSLSGACDCGAARQTAAHFVNVCALHRCPTSLDTPNLDDITPWLADADI